MEAVVDCSNRFAVSVQDGMLMLGKYAELLAPEDALVLAAWLAATAAKAAPEIDVGELMRQVESGIAKS